MPERTVRAAGGVVWRRADGEVQVALVHRPKYDDWSLPKGKLDPGEPAVVGAVREVREETGFVAVPGRTLGESRYRVLDRGRDAPKTVRWWAMRCATGAFVPGPEVDALRWLPVASALDVAGSGFDAAPLQAFTEQEPDTASVLFVGTAAPTGVIARLCATYGARSVVAADGAGDSAGRLAELLGAPLETSPLGLDALLRETALGPPAVVCAGDAAVAEIVPGHVPSAVWALTYSQQRLVDVVDVAALAD